MHSVLLFGCSSFSHILKPVGTYIYSINSVIQIYTVREPLEKLEGAHKNLDEWEIVLYVMSLAFVIEGS